jgi:hypothetical protein
MAGGCGTGIRAGRRSVLCLGYWRQAWRHKTAGRAILRGTVDFHAVVDRVWSRRGELGRGGGVYLDCRWCLVCGARHGVEKGTGLMAQLVVFDCDGVLVDSETLSSVIYAETLTAFGYAIDAEAVNDD